MNAAVTSVLCGFMIVVLYLQSPVVQASGPKPYIKITLEDQQVYSGDSIVLEIESTGLLDPIDVSVLEKDLRFERETVGTLIQVLGGKVVEIALRRMEFTPIRTGSIILGPLQSGETLSNSVPISVLPNRRVEWIPDENELQLHVAVSNTQPLVHQQIVLSVEMIHRYNVSEEKISLPSMTGFTVRPVFEAKRTFLDESKDWRKIAWQYLLFPDRAGTLSMGEFGWQGTLTKSRSERSGFERKSETVNIEVLPAELRSDDWWLPAGSVSIEDKWSSEVTEIRAGDELTRTITISATDVLAGQIPIPTILPSRAIVQTLINEKRSESVELSGNAAFMNSVAVFDYRLKAQSPIPVFLDTVRIPWWNTNTGEHKEAILPARRINVGLPDRADILKELALQDSGLNRWQLWWTDLRLWRVFLYFVAMLVVIFAAGWMLKWQWKKLVDRHLSKKEKKILLQLATNDEWGQLHQKLHEFGKTSLLQSNAKDQIVAHITSRLYGRDPATPDKAMVIRLIQQCDWNPATDDTDDIDSKLLTSL